MGELLGLAGAAGFGRCTVASSVLGWNGWGVGCCSSDFGVGEESVNLAAQLGVHVVEVGVGFLRNARCCHIRNVVPEVVEVRREFLGWRRCSRLWVCTPGGHGSGRYFDDDQDLGLAGLVAGRRRQAPEGLGGLLVGG